MGVYKGVLELKFSVEITSPTDDIEEVGEYDVILEKGNFAEEIAGAVWERTSLANGAKIRVKQLERKFAPSGLEKEGRVKAAEVKWETSWKAITSTTKD